jgi:hypothetical protein
MFRHGLHVPDNICRIGSCFELDQHANIAADRCPILQID